MIRLSRALRSAALVAAIAFPFSVHTPAARADAASLREAMAGDDEDAQLDALGEAAKSNDSDVVAIVVKALGSPSAVVCDAALDALGRMPSPDALRALHAAYRNDTRIKESDVMFASLLKAIGRHGDPSSVEILSDSPFDRLTVESGRARVMGLARIRTRESLDALRAMAVKSSGSRRGVDSSEFMGKFSEALRCAACVLSGKDFGTSRPDWAKWWRDEGKSMTVSPERPKVAADVAKYWERFWGEPYGPDAAAPAADQDKGASGAPFERVDNPSPEVVKEALDGIDAAFRTGDAGDRSLAIEKAGGIMNPDVVYGISRGLRDANRSVRLTAIEVLGWMKDRDALKQLHRMFHREKDLNKDDEVYSELLKAIGRHGDPSSVSVLTENIFKGGLSYASGRARILGLANIRTQDSVEEMFDAMRLGGNSTNRRNVDVRPRFAEDMRLALATATGQDLGTDRDAWQAWWKDNKRKFKISPDRPSIAQDLRSRWESYWGEPY